MLVSPFEPKNGGGAAFGPSPAEGLGVLVYKLFDRSFMNVKSGTNARQRTNQPCTVHLRSLEFGRTRNVFLQGMEV
jgi:hypothetical protein